MAPEKQKNHPKSAPTQKKTPEKKAIHEKKQEVLKAKKDCRVETRKELTQLQLDDLKDNIGHTVVAGENIWRLIYNHAKQTGKTPIKPEKLEGINITVGDKIFFGKNEVVIKYMKGGTKNIAFEGRDNQKEQKTESKHQVPENAQKENKDIKVVKKDEKYTPNKDTLDITLGTINEKHIEELTKKEAQTKAGKIPETQPQKTNVVTIFDPESPLKGDQIAYKHEVEIKSTYGKQITEMIAKQCRGSLIDEDFLYGVIARESRFDKNVKSYTGVKGLGQLTKDTVLTIANINAVKSRKNPENADFFINDDLRTFVPGKKKGEKGKYTVNEAVSLKPINQIKMTLSYLLYLEDLFGEIENKKFKSEIIIAAYNLGPGKTKEILNEYAGVRNREGLKSALQRAARNGDISKAKAKETTEYVDNVKDNIQKSKETKFASLPKKQGIKLAGL